MKKFIIFACSLLLLAGCSKNEIIIYGSSPENNESDNSQPSEKEDALITFSASLESRKVTRSMSPMPKGLVSQIYAFETTDRNFDDPFAEGLYSTASAGVLTGLKGYKMYLSNGSYNMYAFSENSSVYPPDLIDGISAPLKNGIDYLWWENLDQDVTTSQIHMPIVFQHVATQVVVDLSAGDGIKLDSLISASILPPTPGATLDIQTGIIESTYTYDTAPLTMGKNGFLTQGSTDKSYQSYVFDATDIGRRRNDSTYLYRRHSHSGQTGRRIFVRLQCHYRRKFRIVPQCQYQRLDRSR